MNTQSIFSKSKKYNITIISSSGGSVFQEVFRIVNKLDYQINFCVYTDRICGIEQFCSDNQIYCLRVEEKDNKLFSKTVYSRINSLGSTDMILLFFNRLIDESIYNNYLTLNIHPSILPAFKGFNSIKRAIEKNVKYTGVTLHKVDNSIDDGEIIAQTIIPIYNHDITKLEKYAFIQKVYLMLVALEKYYFQVKEYPIKVLYANPCLQRKELVDEFEALQEREGIFIS